VRGSGRSSTDRLCESLPDEEVVQGGARRLPRPSSNRLRSSRHRCSRRRPIRPVRGPRGRRATDARGARNPHGHAPTSRARVAAQPGGGLRRPRRFTAIYLGLDKVVRGCRTGRGVGWAEHDACLFRGTERFFRPGHAAHRTRCRFHPCPARRPDCCGSGVSALSRAVRGRDLRPAADVDPVLGGSDSAYRIPRSTHASNADGSAKVAPRTSSQPFMARRPPMIIGSAPGSVSRRSPSTGLTRTMSPP